MMIQLYNFTSCDTNKIKTQHVIDLCTKIVSQLPVVYNLHIVIQT